MSATTPRETEADTRRAAESAQRQRVRLFMAAQVVAASGILLLAAWVGDGRAPPPFPLDMNPPPRQAMRPDADGPTPSAMALVPAGAGTGGDSLPPPVAEIAPSWAAAPDARQPTP